MNLSLLILIGWMVLSSIVCVFGRKSKYIDKVMPFCTLVQLVLAAVLCIPIIDGALGGEEGQQVLFNGVAVVMTGKNQFHCAIP